MAKRIAKVKDILADNGKSEITNEELEMAREFAAQTGEIGYSGLDVFGGVVQETYTPDLYWPGAYKIYDDMRRRVPSLRALLNAVTMLMHQPRWKFVGDSDSGVDAQAAEFGNSVLEDMGPRFRQFREDAFSALPFGWSWHEVLYARRTLGWKSSRGDPFTSSFDDGLVGWREFAFRRQSSWDSWDMSEDKGELRGMWQQATGHDRVLLPRDKAFHFTPFRDGNNPEGWPLLESAYESYYYLKNYSVILGVGMERALVGWPVFTFEKRPGPQDYDNIKKAVATLLAGSEKGYLTVPPGVEFQFASIVNSNAGILLEIMKYYNILILQTVLADFIWLGIGETGSWAMSKDKTQLFIMAVNGILDSFADALNAGPVRRLFEINAAAFPGLTAHPKIVHTGVHKPMDLEDMANFITSIMQVVEINEDDIINIRQRSGGVLAEAKRGEAGSQPRKELTTKSKLPEQLAGAEADEAEPRQDEAEEENLSEFQVSFVHLRGDYASRLSDIVQEYVNTPRVWFRVRRERFMQTIDRYFTAAFEIGWQDGGGELGIPEEQADFVNLRTQEERIYAETLWETIREAKEGPQDAPSVDGYVKTLEAIYAEGKARAAGRTLMLTFERISETHEPCRTCERLENQRHSAQWWVSKGLIPAVPGNRHFDCKGYNCGHRLRDDEGRPFIPK